jgi:hypothetical protein
MTLIPPTRSCDIITERCPGAACEEASADEIKNAATERRIIAPVFLCFEKDYVAFTSASTFGFLNRYFSK